jgi:peptide/nickel transport system permease protein
MWTFILRRVLASLAVLFVASFLVYNLGAIAGNPLEQLQQSNAPNKEALIRARTELLQLDVPAPVRYFLWLGGVLGAFVGRFDLGSSIGGQPVTALLGSAVGVTLRLVLIASLIAIVVGIVVGITTALRQYSTYDYGATFASFLFFSLPIFWIAVMLKQFVAIGFNDFLGDPVVGTVATIVLTIVSAVFWTVVIGGPPRQRVIVAVVAAAATAGSLVYISFSGWLENPSLGIGVVAVLAFGIALLATVLSTGWANTKSRNTAFATAALVVVLYYPLTGEGYGLFNQFAYMNVFTVSLIVIAVAVLGGVIGYLFGGYDRWQSVRTGALTGFLSMLVVVLDRYMHSWGIYVDQVANGRPIATIGSQTPDLQASFWIDGIDVFTHLLLPTLALILASIASYSRYARASLLDVLNQDYIRTARAKGLTERTVIVRHAFRNALIPLTTIVTLDFGALIGGAVVTETVFGWTGMGQLFQQSLTDLDLNPIMGVFLVTATTAIVFNFVADLVYAALDPRIRVTA